MNRIVVERCWGGKNIYFRLTMPNGEREFVRQETWTRKTATEALDLLEGVYGYCRQAIRFVHK